VNHPRPVTRECLIAGKVLLIVSETSVAA